MLMGGNSMWLVKAFVSADGRAMWSVNIFQ